MTAGAGAGERAALVAACVGAWVRCYTAGLASGPREARRAELASDLWEQRHDPDERHPGTTIALRALFGVPADLAWRLEQAAPGARAARLASGAAHRAGALAGWLGRRGLPGLALGLAALYGAVGLVLLLAGVAGRQGADGNNLAWAAAVCLLCAAAVALGTRRTPRWRWRGPALLALGAVPMALVLAATVLVPLATLTVLAWAGVRALRRRPL